MHCRRSSFALPVDIVRNPTVLVAARQPLDDFHARKQQRGGREREKPEPAGEARRAKERVGPRHIDDKHADEDGDGDACERWGEAARRWRINVEKMRLAEKLGERERETERKKDRKKERKRERKK